MNNGDNTFCAAQNPLQSDQQFFYIYPFLYVKTSHTLKPSPLSFQSHNGFLGKDQKLHHVQVYQLLAGYNIIVFPQDWG